MAGRFEGKVALVTGAGSGIGRATAVAFSREGAKVVVDDINVEGGEETVRMVKEAGGDAIFIRADVSKAAEVQALINKTVATYGRLDCAFNNAGILGDWALTAEYAEEEWDHVISNNLKGVWLCLKYEIPQMLSQGGGAIVNTASVAGCLTAYETSPAYIASKAGIVGLTKAAALEYAPQGIRINAVCPGVIRTPMTDSFTGKDPEAEAQLVAQRCPIGRMGAPEEIASAALWLCSDAASFVIGHAVVVDGGYVLP